MSEKAKVAASEILDCGFIGQGPEVEKFESELRTRLRVEYAATTNSATSAEHIALRLLQNPDINTKNFNSTVFWDSKWSGLQRGDEVLTTALTCTATNWPILANGLDIKWVDVDKCTLNMDLEDLERKLSPKTKVIYVVHWGGNPVDLDKLAEIQETCKSLYGFKPVIIEDCAHAFGSTYNGKPIGSHGNICTFSFQAIKHLTSVDGGLLIVPHEKLYKRAKLLRWYGIDREGERDDFRCESDIAEWGYKMHMNDVNASIGRANLTEVESNVVAKHKGNARYYNDQLGDVNGVTLLEIATNADPSYWIYTLKVERRADFMKMMMANGIAVSKVHERNDKHSCVSEFKTALPNLDEISETMICIPVGWWVTEDQRDHIVKCIKGGW